MKKQQETSKESSQAPTTIQTIISSIKSLISSSNEPTPKQMMETSLNELNHLHQQIEESLNETKETANYYKIKAAILMKQNNDTKNKNDKLFAKSSIQKSKLYEKKCSKLENMALNLHQQTLTMEDYIINDEYIKLSQNTIKSLKENVNKEEMQQIMKELDDLNELNKNMDKILKNNDIDDDDEDHDLEMIEKIIDDTIDAEV